MVKRIINDLPKESIIASKLNQVNMNIYNDKIEIQLLISNDILEFIFCQHNNIRMMRIFQDTKNYFARSVRWMLFICHICHVDLIKNVTIGYPSQTMTRGGLFWWWTNKLQYNSN